MENKINAKRKVKNFHICVNFVDLQNVIFDL